MDNKFDTPEMEFFKALASPESLKIAGLLSLENLSLEEIAKRLGLSMAAANKHLSRLQELGLIKKDAALYRLDTSALEAMARQNLSGQRAKPKAEDFDGEDYDRKVLKDFMDAEGRLKALPMQHKKILAILRHILPVFQPGERYTEKQVNELLRRYNEDTASLRRYLVDEKMLQREKGIYWRP